MPSHPQHHRHRRPVRLPSTFDLSSRRWWVLAVAFRGCASRRLRVPLSRGVVNVPAVGPSRSRNSHISTALRNNFPHRNHMSTQTTTESPTGQHTASRTTTQPTNTPTTQLERSAANRLRTTMAAVSSSPWLSLRATRSRGYASGRPVGACRQIVRGCISGRKVAVVGGCGRWCGRNEAGVKTQRGAGP